MQIQRYISPQHKVTLKVSVYIYQTFIIRILFIDIEHLSRLKTFRDDDVKYIDQKLR